MFYTPPRSFIAGILLGLVISVLIGAIAIYVTIQIPVALNPPTVIYTDVTVLNPEQICPGSILRFKAHVQYRESGVTQTYTSIRDVSSGRNVPGTQTETPVRPQPGPVEFTDTITYSIPFGLPTGNYELVRSTLALNMDAEPSFLIIPFTVKEC